MLNHRTQLANTNIEQFESRMGPNHIFLLIFAMLVVEIFSSVGESNYQPTNHFHITKPRFSCHSFDSEYLPQGGP